MNKTKNEAAAALGKVGGSATLKKRGKKHFKAMARKRWDARRLNTDPVQ